MGAPHVRAHHTHLILFLHQLLIDGGARVDMFNTRPYSMREAREAYTRVARDHGWKIA